MRQFLKNIQYTVFCSGADQKTNVYKKGLIQVQQKKKKHFKREVQLASVFILSHAMKLAFWKVQFHLTSLY